MNFTLVVTPVAACFALLSIGAYRKGQMRIVPNRTIIFCVLIYSFAAVAFAIGRDRSLLVAACWAVSAVLYAHEARRRFRLRRAKVAE